MAFRSGHHRRGSTITFAIMISVVLCALISAMAWVAGESTQRTGKLAKLDQAFLAAETGVQRVQWYCSNNQMGSISSPLIGTVNGYDYSVSWTSNSGTYLLTSVGSLGEVGYRLSETLTAPSSVAVLATGVNFDNRTST